jgi:hypothetical protein
MDDVDNKKRGANNNHKDTRYTMFFRKNAKAELDASKNLVQQNQTVAKPNFYLKSVKPADILLFIRHWQDYNSKYRVRVSPTTIVQDEILIQMKFDCGILDDDMYDLTPTQFMTHLSELATVSSRRQFFDEFSRSISHLEKCDWSHVEPNNHQAFFISLLVLQDHAVQAFNFMMEHNSHHVPNLRHDYGLARVFLNKIDSKYCKDILSSMKELRDYKNEFKKFMKDFIFEASKHYKTSKTMLNTVPYRGAAYSDPTDKAPYTKVSSDRRIDEKPRPRHGDRNLHAMNDEHSAESDDDFAEPDIPPDRHTQAKPIKHVTVSKPHIRATRFTPDSDDSDTEEAVTPVFNISDYIDEETLHNIDTSNLSKTFGDKDKQNGCMYHCLFGQCLKKERCNFASTHNAAGDINTAKWMMSILKKKTDPPTKILSSRGG